jgi:hypothetical protein
MMTETTMPVDYFVTVIDIWIIAQKFSIPIILFSSSVSIKQIGIISMEPGTEISAGVPEPTIDPKPHRMKNSWIIMGRTTKGTSDKFYFVRSPTTANVKTTKDTNVVSENSMVYGSFLIDDLGTTSRDNHLGTRLRDALTGGKDYGARARKIEEFFDDISFVK